MKTIEKLNRKIRSISKRISAEEIESNVVYLGDKAINVGNYIDCIPNNCQADSQMTKMCFSLGDRKYLIFSTSVKTAEVNTKSYDNYGGLIYILEPLTEEIAQEIVNSKTFSKL